MKKMKNSKFQKRKGKVQKKLRNMQKTNEKNLRSVLESEIEKILVEIEAAEKWVLKELDDKGVKIAHKAIKPSFMAFISEELAKSTGMDAIFSDAKYNKVLKEIFEGSADLQSFWDKEPIEKIRWLLKVHDKFLDYHANPDTF